MSKSSKSLETLRAEIDRIDSELHALLLARNAVSRSIGQAKAKGSPTFRPGREAQIMTALLEKDSGGLPKQVLLRIWREIISASLVLQNDFSIAAADSKSAAMARDHFGVLTEVRELPSAARVIDEVEKGEVSLGVLPLPGEEREAAWWRHLFRDDAKRARIIARLPFARPASPSSGQEAEALVVAAFEPEASGTDRSYLALSLMERVSRSALREQLSAAGLELSGALDVLEESGHNFVFCEVEGFLQAGSPELTALQEKMEDNLERVQVLGCYAVPLDPALFARDAEEKTS